MFIQTFFNELNKNNIRYVLVGGLAVNLHGIPRSTFDIDIIIALDNNNIEQFWNVIKYFNMSPRQPITLNQLKYPQVRQSWIKDKNLIALTFHQNDPPQMEVDLLLQTFDMSFDDIYNNAVTFKEKGISLKAASVDSLIKLKKQSKREQDIQDIKFLEQLR